MTIVNAIAKWRSDGEGIRKSDLRSFVALHRAEPLCAAFMHPCISLEGDTKCIDWYSVPEKLNL